MDIKTVVASAAASLAVVAISVPVMVSYVTLQPTSPGVADTGNINVSGTAIAGKVRVGTTVAGGALIRVLDAGASGGIYSQSQGNGVYSESAGASGALSGGQFIARSTGGRGVIGSATATSGNTRGGLFDSKSPTGVGVYGVSSATSGTGVGVFGSATAASGTAIVGINPNANQRVEIAGPNGAINLNDGYVNRNYGAGLRAAIPIAYGYIMPDGSIASGSGNFTVNKTGTGQYEVTITGENYVYNLYTTVATGAFNESYRVASGSGTLAINVLDKNNVAADAYTNFVVFKSSPTTLYPRVPKHGFKDDIEWAIHRPAEFRAFQKKCKEAERASAPPVGP